MADTALLIAQISSILTVLAGIYATILTIKAASGLADDGFKRLILHSVIFLILSIIGTVSMAYYHITERGVYSETAENIWYAFMFLALIFSLYKSYKFAEFGKRFSLPDIKTAKTSKKKSK